MLFKIINYTNKRLNSDPKWVRKFRNVDYYLSIIQYVRSANKFKKNIDDL